MKRALLAALALLVSLPATAGELPAFFEGVRPLGMGGAFTAVADDQNALFYNPAGLAGVKKGGFAILNPLVEANEDGIDFFRDADASDLDDIVEVVALLREHMGENIRARAALYPSFYRKNFAAAALGQVTANVRPENPNFPQARVDALGTVSGHAGLGFGFLGDALRVGAAAKYVRAERLQEVYTAEEIAAAGFEDQVEDDRRKGAGFGVDVGVMLRFPLPFEPTLAIVLQNVGDTKLGDAGKIPQQLNVGVSATHSFGWLTLTAAADWVDLTQNVHAIDPLTRREIDDDDTYRRLHFGLEGRLWNRLALRAGLYQGYASFGAGLDLWLLKLDYATYAEEMGAFAGQTSDRRHAVQLTLGW